MIEPFHFAKTPKLYFGAGKFGILPELISGCKNILLCTGSKSLMQNSKWQKFQDSAIESLQGFYIEQIKTEPSPDIVDSITKKYHNKQIEMVIAIGGGSVIDAGKAVAAMLPLNEGVKKYLEGVGTGEEHPGGKIPFIATPTTSGTGSEATKNAVLSQVSQNGFKKSLRHDNFVPDIAIVDPELVISCPPDQTAISGMDAFTQLLESYVSIKATPMTDALAYSGLKQILTGLPRAVQAPDDIGARSKVAYAAFVSGITLANAGLGVVHGFASAIGGLFPVPHGVVCGILPHPANRLTISKLEKQNPQDKILQKFATIGRLFHDKGEKSTAYYCKQLIVFLEKWTNEFNLPKLSEYGIKKSDIECITSRTSCKNNPVKLTQQELGAIISESL